MPHAGRGARGQLRGWRAHRCHTPGAGPRERWGFHSEGCMSFLEPPRQSTTKGQLKTTECLLSQCWRLEVQNRVSYSLRRTRGRVLPASPSCRCRWQSVLGVPWLGGTSPQSLPPSSHGLLLWVSASTFPSSYKHAAHWIEGLILINYICKDSIPK